MSIEKKDLQKDPTKFNNESINYDLYENIGLKFMGLNFYFNSDTKLLGEFDNFNKYLEKAGFVKIFDTEHMLINKNGIIDEKLLSKLDSLAIQNKNVFLYSYIVNLYFPGDGVYSFYLTPKFNGKADNRVYYDIDEYLSKIKEFLKIRKDEEYFVSIFSSSPGSGKGPSILGLQAANNKEYIGDIEKVA